MVLREIVSFAFPRVLMFTESPDVSRESWCFPRVLMFPETKWRATSGLKGKQNYFLEGPYVKCFVEYLDFLLNNHIATTNKDGTTSIKAGWNWKPAVFSGPLPSIKLMWARANDHAIFSSRKQWMSIVGVKCRREWLLTKICGRKLWTVDGSESVLRAWLCGRTFDFHVHGSSSRLVLTFFFYLQIYNCQ